MQLLAERRRCDLNHEELAWHDGTFQHWASKRSAEFPFHYLDGVTIWVHDFDVDPDSDWLDPPKLPSAG